jgi:hypothetical protein
MDEWRPLWVWENEGGSRGPRHDPVSPARRPGRPPQDTPEGCLAMAAADMARADKQAAGWRRTRFEHSAVMWSRRARRLADVAQRLR